MMIIVTPCGSGRFKQKIFEVAEAIRDEGFVALPPTLISMEFAGSLQPDQALLAWKGGTYSHLQRIRRCDICLICNFEGYIGAGTTLELGYATAMGSLVVALRQDAELARQSVFDEVLETETPTEIAKRLHKLVKNRQG